MTSPDPQFDVDYGVELGTVELIEAAGATYRKVDYWTRCGYLQTIGANTPGSGRQRRYAPSEVAVARALNVLVPLASANAFDPGKIARWIRFGLRGQVPILPGVIVDLRVLCQD